MILGETSPVKSSMDISFRHRMKKRAWICRRLHPNVKHSLHSDGHFTAAVSPGVSGDFGRRTVITTLVTG